MRLFDKLGKVQRELMRIIIGTLFLLFSITTIEAGTFKLDLNGCKADLNNGYSGQMVTSVSSGDTTMMYFCDDAFYTDGNLKHWAELDMVPHHIVFSNTSGSAKSFTFNVGGDYKNSNDPTVQGWDHITELTLDVNATLSLNGGDSTQVDRCKSVGSLSVQNIYYSLAGDWHEIFREVNVTDFPDDLKCVAIYNMRLAIGSHKYPGSSLQSRLTSASAHVGDQTLPLPDIASTSFGKVMTAVQGGSRNWTVVKSSNPSKVTFEETCTDDTSLLEKDVNITVSWIKGDLTPQGKVNVATIIQATNHTRRDLNISVVDTLYNSTTQLATYNCDMFTLQAGLGNAVVCANTFEIDASDAIGLYDNAVATFIDLDSNVSIPKLEANATAFVQGIGENLDENATIKDHEWITENNFNYSVESFINATGSFDNYTAGTKTDGDVNWTSSVQTDTGSVTFLKKVYSQRATATTGTLSDEASSKGSDGAGAFSGTHNIEITSSASVSLTITKIMDEADIPDGETLDFNFTVRNPIGFNQTYTLEVNDANPSSSITISGLDPMFYNVQENAKFGYEAEGNSTRIIDLNLPICSGSVEFSNIIADRPAVKVRKVTFPQGSEAGWEMIIYKQNPGVPITWTELARGTTVGGGWLTLIDSDNLHVGTYKIEETMQNNWYETSKTAECTFSYDPDVDGNRSDYECIYANAEYSKIIINKVVEGSSLNPFTFTQDINISDPLALNDSESKTYSNLRPGTYTVTEDDPTPDFDLINLTCTDTENTTTDTPLRKADIELEAGETVECTFTNQERGRIDVTKLEDGSEPSEIWTFTIEGTEGIMERNTSGDGTNLILKMPD